MNKRVAKKIRKIIALNQDAGFVKQDYSRAKKQYNKLSKSGRQEFLKLLEDFYSNR